jgi:uncharacterized protein YicC (UPF0701 family)
VAGVGRRLDRLEESERAAAAAWLRNALAVASDEAIAQAVAAFRRGDTDESETLFAAIGMTAESVERAVGPAEEVDPEALQRRLDGIFCEVLSEPRRSTVRHELARLGGEEV